MLKYSYDACGNTSTQTVEAILPPEITGQPVKQIVGRGELASFSVVVADASGVTFQWKFNGVDIPGATGDSLLLTQPIVAAAEGKYLVVVTNSAGSVTSAAAALMLDTDDDGMPDSWEIANFNVLEKPTDDRAQQSEGDPDKDGVSNLDEFLDGTNPLNDGLASGDPNPINLRPRLTAYSDAGGSLKVVPRKLRYELGETVTLVPTAVAPSVFAGWAGDLAGTDNPATIVMTGNKKVRARFAAALPPAPGLVSWWRAENDARDITGANDGTLLGGVSFVAGEVGQAFRFDGPAHEVKMLASDSLNVGAGNGLTLEAWIRPADLVTPSPLFEWNDGTGSTMGSHFWINVGFSGQGGPGTLFTNIVDTSNNSHLLFSTPGVIQKNVWQHVALTYDRLSGIARMFLNGVAVASASLGSFVPRTTTNLHLGFHSGVPGLAQVSYSGLLDEPAIYNRALTENEIADIHNAALAGKNFTQPYFTTPFRLPNGTLGGSYSQQVNTVMGNGPVSFSLSTTGLPPGITLSSAGAITGIPGASGIFDFTVRATDTAGAFVDQLCVLSVS